MHIQIKDEAELREKLLVLFRRVYPKGKPDKQKEMCETLSEKRIDDYIKILESHKKGKT